MVINEFGVRDLRSSYITNFTRIRSFLTTSKPFWPKPNVAYQCQPKTSCMFHRHMMIMTMLLKSAFKTVAPNAYVSSDHACCKVELKAYLCALCGEPEKKSTSKRSKSNGVGSMTDHWSIYGGL